MMYASVNHLRVHLYGILELLCDLPTGTDDGDLDTLQGIQSHAVCVHDVATALVVDAVLRSFGQSPLDVEADDEPEVPTS